MKTIRNFKKEQFSKGMWELLENALMLSFCKNDTAVKWETLFCIILEQDLIYSHFFEKFGVTSRVVEEFITPNKICITDEMSDEAILSIGVENTFKAFFKRNKVLNEYDFLEFFYFIGGMECSTTVMRLKNSGTRKFE